MMRVIGMMLFLMFMVCIFASAEWFIVLMCDFMFGGGVDMNNKVYDVLKWIAQILLPALGALYFALAGIWGFPYGEEIVGTITAVDAFLGICLGISSANYKADHYVG